MKRNTIFALSLALTGIFFILDFAFTDEQQGQQPGQMQQMQAKTAQPPQTLANLMQDYNTWSNTKEKYTAYAQKADQEGYKKAAQLFRAAAKSVEIHNAFLAKNISELGAAPKADIKQPVVKSTKENLEEAIMSEDSQAGVLYQKYIEQAKADDLKMPGMAFNSGLKVGESRKKLFENSLMNLKAWKKSAKNGFYVCKICGNLAVDLNFANCPVCKAPVTEFEKVL
jgi:rubrerythrin